MIIRKANQHEYEQIRLHSLQVLQEASMGFIYPEQEKLFQMITPFLEQGGYYLVSVDKDVLKGWIAVGSTFDYHQGKPAGMIPELYVLPYYRRQGIAADLCQTAIAHLQDSGFGTVQLNVFAGNPIKSFYEKLGFKEISSLLSLDLK